MDPATFEKAKAELRILRRFIDFVNRQVGVYCDALASFNGNKVRPHQAGHRPTYSRLHGRRARRSTGVRDRRDRYRKSLRAWALVAN